MSSTTRHRIVSLVPSVTELLFYLGLGEEIAGITKFCVHPAEGVQTKRRIGGTKNIDTSLIRSLSPTTVIASKEENIKDQVAALESFTDVWLTDVKDFPGALQMIAEAGRRFGKDATAAALVRELQTGFAALCTSDLHKRPKAVYLIWRSPYMTAGGDTFISDMLYHAGFDNAFAHRHRYPAVTVEEIAATQPQYVLLSSEPYPFREKHITELQEDLPGVKIILVDGEMFSWYGSRMLEAPAYFRKLQLLIATGAEPK